jgi:16S rRNA pseudouridine516 synthase
MKMDRWLGKHEGMGRKQAHLLIQQGRVAVDGAVVVDKFQEIDRFSTVTLDGAVIQQAQRQLFIMLHKPAGVVSATVDAEHTTVIDLIDDPNRHELHLVGRLDRFTTGMVLLTNDGRWSKRLTLPGNKVPKTYLVETATEIPDEAVEAFRTGFYFHTEDLHTMAAELEILAPRKARLVLHEGRYHQVKRMFHRIDNQVTALHRTGIGKLILPDDLLPGQWRYLSGHEVDG